MNFSKHQTSVKSEEELLCERYFVETYRCDKNGKFIVSLSLRQDVELGDSMGTTEKTLNSLKHLDKNIEMKELYVAVCWLSP